MSFHREVVIWRSGEDYFIGFFDSCVIGDDPEWDVDYNYDAFEWASGPHSSVSEAFNAWRGANPGGYTLRKEKTEHYDEMFQAWKALSGA